MKSVITKKSWLYNSDLRLDASYHLSEGVNTKRIFKLHCPFPLISLKKEASELFKGDIHKRVYVTSPDHGIMFYSASDFFKSDLNTGKYLSKKYSPHLKDLELKKDWILITRSGTLGKVIYTAIDYEGKIGTDDLVRIKPSENNLLKGYMYAFLSSRFGHGLLTQSSYGGVVKHIEPHHAGEVEIPILPETEQRKINKLILDAVDLRVEANKLLQEADHKFHDLNDISYTPDEISASENSAQIGNAIKFSSLFLTTIKARNHSTRANRIIAKWDSKAGFNISEVLTKDGLTRGMGGFFKRTTDKKVKGMDIVSQGDIHDQKPVFKQVIKKGIKESEIARRGMIIFPAAGTLGENEIFLRPQMIYKNFEGKVLSEVVGKIRPKNINESAYLFAALRSIGGFRVLRAMVYGTNLMYPNWELLKNLRIPCKDDATKMTISKIIIDYYEKISLANEKEALAIELVEKEIESWQK